MQHLSVQKQSLRERCCLLMEGFLVEKKEEIMGFIHCNKKIKNLCMFVVFIFSVLVMLRGRSKVIK